MTGSASTRWTLCYHCFKKGRESEGGRARDRAGARAGGFMLEVFFQFFLHAFSAVGFFMVSYAFRAGSGSDFGVKLGPKSSSSRIFWRHFRGSFDVSTFDVFFVDFSKARNFKNVVFA